MEGNRGIFVKVNYKNIGELNSFIYDVDYEQMFCYYLVNK